MKKRARLIAVLALLTGFTVFCGCPGENADGNNNKNKENGEDESWPWHHEGLDLETELQIRQDYLKELQSNGEALDLTINDVWVKKYYGTFNGCVAVMTDYTDANWGTEERFVKHHYLAYRLQQPNLLRYEDGNSIRIWKDGEWYDLGTAREMELFDEKSFHRIANGHNGLDEETERWFTQEYINFIINGPTAPTNPDMGSIYLYYGTYSGWEVTMIHMNFYGTNERNRIRVAGFDFWFQPMHIATIVWKRDETGNITWGGGIEGAYSMGRLTTQDIAEIHRIHSYYWYSN